MKTMMVTLFWIEMLIWFLFFDHTTICYAGTDKTAWGRVCVCVLCGQWDTGHFDVEDSKKVDVRKRADGSPHSTCNTGSWYTLVECAFIESSLPLRDIVCSFVRRKHSSNLRTYLYMSDQLPVRLRAILTQGV